MRKVTSKRPKGKAPPFEQHPPLLTQKSTHMGSKTYRHSQHTMTHVCTFKVCVPMFMCVHMLV